MELSNGTMLSQRTIALGGTAVFLLYALFCILLNLPRSDFGAKSAAQTSVAPGSTRAKMRVGSVVAPVSLSARLKQGLVTLTGTVPDERARSAILVRARTLAGEDGKIEDKLIVNHELVVTQWFDRVLAWFPPKLEGLQEGEFNVSGASVTLLGQVASLEEKMSLSKSVAEVIGPTATLYNTLQVNSVLQKRISRAVEGAALEHAIGKVVREGRVQFESGSDILSSGAREALEELAPVLKQFPGVALQINGNSETTAGAAREQLSEARAKAIKGFLVARGVDGQRLKPRGCEQSHGASGNGGSACPVFRVLDRL